MCSVAPRGVYVCGNTTTTSGLTVTLSKDSSSGDFALEAGALVLGDQGKRPKQIIILGLFFFKPFPFQLISLQSVPRVIWTAPSQPVS